MLLDPKEIKAQGGNTTFLAIADYAGTVVTSRFYWPQQNMYQRSRRRNLSGLTNVVGYEIREEQQPQSRHQVDKDTRDIGNGSKAAKRNWVNWQGVTVKRPISYWRKKQVNTKLQTLKTEVVTFSCKTMLYYVDWPLQLPAKDRLQHLPKAGKEQPADLKTCQ